MCLHAYKLPVISVVIILKVMGICCSNLSLLSLSKWDDSCMHVCCECQLNSKHAVKHYLVFKGKAEGRSPPGFALCLELKKQERENGGGGW